METYLSRWLPTLLIANAVCAALVLSLDPYGFDACEGVVAAQTRALQWSLPIFLLLAMSVWGAMLKRVHWAWVAVPLGVNAVGWTVGLLWATSAGVC